MTRSSRQDVVIRSRMTTAGTEFVVMCGKSSRLLGGPFGVMTEALAFAVDEAKGRPARILYEAHDERGRTIGERLVLQTTRPEM